MNCVNCGRELKDGQKFCTGCGKALFNSSADSVSTTHNSSPIIGRVLLGVIALFVFIGLLSGNDEESIKVNNDALQNYERGNTEQAIDQLRDATKLAESDEARLNALKNLGYTYSSEQNKPKALETFNEALQFTKPNTFDYYLVSGEIAYLEGRYTSAYNNLTKAYNLNPEDFQVNNSLAIFHLDLEDAAPQYVNYPKALSYAQKTYSLNNAEFSRQNLGIAHLFNENYDQAIYFLNRSNLTLFPEISLWLGLAYAGKEDVANAKYYLGQAVNSGVELPAEAYLFLYSQ